jgi:hypothetical protein
MSLGPLCHFTPTPNTARLPQGMPVIEQWRVPEDVLRRVDVFV